TSAVPLAKRDIKEDLLKRATDLEKAGQDFSKKLRDEGKKVEADVVDKEVEAVKRIAKELEAAKEEREVERLEVELLVIEDRLNDIIKRGDQTRPPRPTSTVAPRVRRDIKDDLLKRAQELEKAGQDASKKLKDEGRTREAEELDREVAIVQRIAKELEAAKEERQVERLEVELLEVENRLNDLIKRDDRTRPPQPTTGAPRPTTGAPRPSTTGAPNDVKDDLLKRAQELEKEGQAESKKLRDEGKKVEADLLDKEIEGVQRIAKELEAAKDEKQIERLEAELKIIEDRLAETIKRDERTRPPRPTSTVAPRVRRDIKDDLLKRAQELEKAGQDASKKLKDEGRTREAEELDREVATVQRIAKELEAAKDERQVERLEVELLGVENRLNDLIKRDDRTRPPQPTTGAPRPTTGAPRPTTGAPGALLNDLKEDLLKRAQDLEKEGQAESKKLKDEGKTREAEELNREVEAVQRIAKELEAAKDEREVERLEVELLVIENRLADIIKRDDRTRPPQPTTGAPRPTTQAACARSCEQFSLHSCAVNSLAATVAPVDPVKDQLIKRGETLEARIKATVAKLTAEKREHLAGELLAEEARVIALINELKTTSPGPEALRLLEAEIGRVEDRVDIEERLIDKETEAQDTLLKNAQTLKGYVTQEIAILQNVTGPQKEQALRAAERLRREESRLEQIAKELVDAQTPRRIAEYEVELRVIEVNIEEALRDLHFIPTPSPAPTPKPTPAPTPKPTPAPTKPPTKPPTWFSKLAKVDSSESASDIDSKNIHSLAAPTEVPPAPTTGAPGTTRAADPVRDLLIKRGEELEARIKATVKKLTDEKREHLAGELLAEEQRIEPLINELKTTSPGPEALKLLEAEITRIEDRVEIEERLIEKETETQETLLKNAKILKEYVTEEIAILQNVTGEHRHQAEQAARALRRDELRLEQLSAELVDAQTPRRIAEYEVELRTIEVRIYEVLRQLDFHPPTPTPSPVTTVPPTTTSTGTGTYMPHPPTKA
ncbi:unnamed protein product, partial [Oppiella nova]